MVIEEGDQGGGRKARRHSLVSLPQFVFLSLFQGSNFKRGLIKKPRHSPDEPSPEAGGPCPQVLVQRGHEESWLKPPRPLPRAVSGLQLCGRGWLLTSGQAGRTWGPWALRT